MTTNQAAERLKISRSAVLKLLSRGQIQGIKEQRDWTVFENSVKRYQAERKEPGWPKKPSDSTP
jgi:excisionase family DNA binding protein